MGPKSPSKVCVRKQRIARKRKQRGRIRRLIAKVSWDDVHRGEILTLIDDNKDGEEGGTSKDAEYSLAYHSERIPHDVFPPENEHRDNVE